MIRFTDDVQFFRNTISNFQSKLKQWGEYDALRDECVAWLRDTDALVHSINLKSTCEEKQLQSESLKVNFLITIVLEIM